MSVDMPTRARSSAALVLAGVLWGTGGLAGSLLAQLAGLHPLAVAAYRLLVGGGIATLAVLLKGGTFPRTAEAGKRLLAVGGLFALFQASYFAAVALSSVSIATMTTIGAAPVFVTLAAVRKPGRWTLVSVAGTVAGLVLLRWSPEEPAHLLGGLGFALLAAAGFATLTLLTAKPVLDPLATTAYGCLIGGLLLTPVATWTGMALPLHADVLAVVCYLGAVPTALAYAAYLRGLATAHPVLGALSAVLEPLTATVLAALLFGERLGVTAWCGAAVLVAALAIGYWRPEPA
ncbi:drug/metabolite transporter, DME family [Amycolatopsis pretoriensis]|uniref:Drug/metabolite transporter, DME family n=1 Tax=Amycolatopsis pretoriensis TaxID=218821 RepID=A0A1H5R8Q1_9PSEU|nr:EamA family transporter [Amycolatopsis pretoriensis]SEF33961.1 drug/metabolite transporter, DME family [Amycolatopsis pretoriensis]